MRARKVAATVLLVLILSFSIMDQVSAQQPVITGPYAIEVSWLNEPPIAGQANAMVMKVTYKDNPASPVSDDEVNLILNVSYGGQSMPLTLQPLGNEKPGQFIAPILPSAAGLYTVDIVGSIGTTDDIEVEVQPEKVLRGEAIQFPQAKTGAGGGELTWLMGTAVAALVISLAALILAILAIRKRL